MHIFRGGHPYIIKLDNYSKLNLWHLNHSFRIKIPKEDPTHPHHRNYPCRPQSCWRSPTTNSRCPWELNVSGFPE